MPAVQDIFIDQLRLRASSREAQLITNDLENSSWSVNTNHEWIFIREISVRYGINQIRQSASQEINNHISQAVDGRFGHAENANAVFFRSLPELLAFLLRDLVRNEALRKWYWKKWTYLLAEPGSQAVNRLLWEYSEYLPALVEELVVINRLPEVWKCLSENSAEQITEKLKRSSSSEIVSEDLQQDTNVLGVIESVNLSKQAFYQQRSKLIPWIRALSTLEIDDKRYQLAAIVAATQYCPLILEQSSFAVVHGFSDFIEQLRKNSNVQSHLSLQEDIANSNSTSLTDINNASSPPSEKPDQPSNIESLDSDNPDSEAETAQIVKDVAQQSSGDRSLSKDFLDKQNHRAGLQRDLANSAKKDSVSEQNIQENVETALGSKSFYTLSGGLFYLINALNNRIYQELLQENKMVKHVSGWLWLFDLSRRLGAKLDLHILQFTADECGYENIDSLLATAPLVELDTVEVALSARYQNKDFWNPSLVNVPAHIVSTASHIDVFYSLDSVRMSVRLSGLDINPGWVPWLGRVITFHYREEQWKEGSANAQN